MTASLQQIRVPKIIRPEHAFGYTIPRYRQEEEGDHGTDPDPLHEVNYAFAIRMWNAIQAVYPGHPILTHADFAQGIAALKVPLFTPQPYILHLAKLKADPGLTRVVKAAGEILERYRIPRAGFKVEHWVNAMTRFKPTHRMTDKPPE